VNQPPQIEYLDQQEISMETFQYAAQGHEGDQCILGSLQNFRFKKNKRMSINPPSITLHITNIVKQVCYDDYYVR
jgi:hypothetical protein